MDLSGITSSLAQEYGYSESELTNLLSDRMDKYQKLMDQAEETLAATELGKSVNADDKVSLPAVGCSLGNIDIAGPLRTLARRDLEKYEALVATLTSGDDAKFMKALKEITSETETTLRTEFAKLNQGSAAKFVDNLSRLTAVNDSADYTEYELEAIAQARLNNLTATTASATGVNKDALARTIRGIQIYV
ncbi:MAG: hypothetical protein IJD04_01020 [Desulfovibrionaceae bacterium]|nr:hypothetical protein [Desulfovibrionaceae bacterium]